MARVGRTRTRVVNNNVGSKKIYNGLSLISNTASLVQDVESCLDSHGRPLTDSAFQSSQWSGELPAINGQAYPTAFPTVYAVYDNFGVVSRAALSTMNVLTAPAGWELDLIAGTNPSRPVMNLPIWVQNIVQLPAMVRDLGKLLSTPEKLANPKGAASTYLGEQFGWAPLIDDIGKLIDFQGYVIKRSKELNDLASGSGIRRKLSFSDDTVSSDGSASGSIFGAATFTHRYSAMVKRTTWATIRWKPTSPPPYHPSDKENHDLAANLVLGLTPEGLAKGTWDVLPWTWLLGWFTNLGKYTLAHS